MKRRHSAIEARSEPAKRSNHEQHLDSVCSSADLLIQHCTTATDDADAIARLTAALDCLDDARTSLLIARANLLEKKSKSADAVADALKVIESDPTCTNGYLMAGQIYANQGKQQLAIDIYERGLCVMAPSEWPLLYEGRERAKQRLYQGVDFVARLPTEILETIFAQAVHGRDLTLTNCLQISKSWRDCLLYRCPTLWKSVFIKKAYKPCNNTAGQVIRFISNQVQSLMISAATNANLEYLVALAENGKLTSVKSLEIESDEIPHQDITAYMSLIHLFRDNLTKLTVSWNLTKDTLGTVLSLCPNLEYIHLSDSHDITFQPLQSPPPEGYRLRRLYLQSENDEDILEDLLSHCPRLEALAALDINANILDLIDRCCPLLRHLNANSYADPPHWGPDDAYDNPIPPGLYTLNFNTYSDTPMRDCLSLLNKSKDTLRMLGLKLYDTVDDQQLRFGLSQLTTLRLRINEGRFGTAESIIRQSPMLEVISLNFRVSRAPDHFLVCLETHARLRDLSLIEFDVNSQDLQQFFDHRANQYQSCALQSISLLECEEDVVTDEVLASLANITTLQRIDLIEALESTTYEGIVAFIEQLHRLPQLETIRLRELDEINDDMIVEIAKIDGLRALYLCDMDEITSSGVRALADTASSTLRDVSVIHCSGVNDKATKYLYRKVLSNAHHFTI